VVWFALSVAAIVAGLISLAGIGQLLAGLRAVRNHAAVPITPAVTMPPITLLKPLYGDEPLLEQALESYIRQDYPKFQIVFGVQDREDPAIPVVERLRARNPDHDIALVIDPTQHGANRKVSNLINMYPLARHDLLVIADSDQHCAPDYLQRIAAAFAPPGTGLVTTIYVALAANAGLAARLGATAMTHIFLPGTLMSRALGREDCLGATMALSRETLERIGGLPALVDHLADDNILGQLVRGLGLKVGLALTVPATTVPETTLDALFRHELRWSRTILSLVPLPFALSSIQYPIGWAVLAFALSGSAWAAGLFALAWLVRGFVARAVDAALAPMVRGLATPAPIWLLPLRDVLSLAIILASYASDKVEWRGQMMHTRQQSPLHAEPKRAGAAAKATSEAPQGTVLS
jgi:ceramide glucosyltransferase